MIKDRKNVIPYLVDMRYKNSMNHFYEFYGENVPYASIEQHSYIELKSLFSELIAPNIKFRKFERNGIVLTLKIEMLDEELEKFRYLLNKNKFSFVHDFEVANIRVL